MAIEGAAMRRPTLDGISARVVAGLAMGCLMLVLTGSASVGPAGSSRLGQALVQLLFPAAVIVTVLIVVFSTTARAAWGRLCLANALGSLLLAAASVHGRAQPFWTTDPLYEHALDKGMHWWLGHLLRTAAAYSGAMIVAAMLLFALASWLLQWPRRRWRAAP